MHPAGGAAARASFLLQNCLSPWRGNKGPGSPSPALHGLRSSGEGWPGDLGARGPGRPLHESDRRPPRPPDPARGTGAPGRATRGGRAPSRGSGRNAAGLRAGTLGGGHRLAPIWPAARGLVPGPALREVGGGPRRVPVTGPAGRASSDVRSLRPALAFLGCPRPPSPDRCF